MLTKASEANRADMAMPYKRFEVLPRGGIQLWTNAERLYTAGARAKSEKKYIYNKKVEAA